MDLRLVLVLFGCVVAVTFGRQQCEDQRECIRLRDCPEYQLYDGKPFNSLPLAVKSAIKRLDCSRKQGKTNQISTICCELEPGIASAEYNSTVKAGYDQLDLKMCGKSGRPLISGGRIAELFVYPWMALLGDIDNFHCGGSLITASFVLTAAHCNRQKNVYYVRLGETDLSTEIDCDRYANGDEVCAEKYQDIKVDRFIAHQRYKPSSKNNDIALVKLVHQAVLNYSVKPICLPLPEMLTGKQPNKMVVSGWGFTEDRNELSQKLRYAHVPIVDPIECQLALERINNTISLDDSQLCAGGGRDGADNCSGDSGGPLQYYGEKAHVIHGIVSFGLASCGKERQPGVYTKVPYYLNWILYTLGSQVTVTKA